MQKLFFFDLETTGLDPVKCAIHQIAGKVIIDGVVKDSFNIKIRPFEGAEISDEALNVAGVTLEQIMSYQPMEEGYGQLMTILNRWINRFDKKDKFFVGGYNVATFDIPFMRRLFELNGNKYYGSYFWSVPLDVMILAGSKMMAERSGMIDFKQGTVARELGITIDESKLHDALYDIDVCYEIYKKVLNKETPVIL